MYRGKRQARFRRNKVHDSDAQSLDYAQGNSVKVKGYSMFKRMTRRIFGHYSTNVS
jgi:hypothetical protein